MVLVKKRKSPSYCVSDTPYLQAIVPIDRALLALRPTVQSCPHLLVQDFYRTEARPYFEHMIEMENSSSLHPWIMYIELCDISMDAKGVQKFSNKERIYSLYGEDAIRDFLYPLKAER